MTLKTATQVAQMPLVAEFTFNFDDTMLDIAAASKDFGLTNIAATSFDLIRLPPGSVVIGGEIVTETAFDTAGYAVVLGDSAVANRYHASADLKGAARVALTPTGYHNTGGLALRIGITNTDVCTTGKMTVRVLYTVDNRVNEIL